MGDTSDAGLPTVPLSGLLDLALDLWRLQRRALRDTQTPAAVLTACERAMETLQDQGIEIRELVGERYDENLRVCVVHQEGGPLNRMISECLSPAIFYRAQMVRRAEVVIRGEASIEQPDS